MIVASNHIKTLGIPFPEGAIVRINVAWIKSYDELCKIIEDNKNYEVWVDYPTGRTKPPVPKLTLAQAISAASKYSNVKYFAFSNAEDCNVIELIRQAVPSSIKLVPKIETEKGINELAEILKSAKTDMIMLDAEDLYVDVGTDPIKLESLKTYVKTFCEKYNVKMLSLQGVIFG
jgi:pyruvate kinase